MKRLIILFFLINTIGFVNAQNTTTNNREKSNTNKNSQEKRNSFDSRNRLDKEKDNQKLNKPIPYDDKKNQKVFQNRNTDVNQSSEIKDKSSNISFSNQNCYHKKLRKLPPNALEIFANTHYFFSISIESILQRWILYTAILSSFEVTATLCDWEISEKDKAGAFLFEVTNSDKNEINSKKILVMLQKPTLYAQDFFVKDKSYTFFITEFKALEWKSIVLHKFSNQNYKTYFGLIIENKK